MQKLSITGAQPQTLDDLREIGNLSTMLRVAIPIYCYNFLNALSKRFNML